MKLSFTILTLAAFCTSPAAFGQSPAPEQIYKATYINLMRGKDAGQVLKGLLDSAAAAHVGVKDVLEAAVHKGWMTQEQLDTVLEVAAKNPRLASQALTGKVANGRLSGRDVAALASALQGRVNGASYFCGHYGCYQGGNGPYFYAAFLFVVMVVAIILSPLYTGVV